MIRVLENRPYTPKDREKWVKQTKKPTPPKETTD